MKFLNHTTPIGLDIGTRCVKAVQLVHGRGGPRISAAACLDRATPSAPITAAEAETIRAVLGRQGFVGARVVACAPTASLLTSVMDLPPRSSGAPLEHIARVELSRSHGCAPNDLEMAWWELPAGTRALEGTNVFAVALRHADANGLLDALEAAGFAPDALDSGLLALARLCTEARGSTVTGLLDLGVTGATIAVLHGQKLVYQRTLPDGGLAALLDQLIGSLRIEPDVAEFLVRRIGLGEDLTPEQRDWEMLDDARAAIGDFADAIGAEVKASLAYASRRHGSSELGAVMAAGGGAAVPGLAERIERGAEATVRLLRPSMAAAPPDDPLASALADDPRLACATGLAAHQLACARTEGVAA